jgi:hypothetical protein
MFCKLKTLFATKTFVFKYSYDVFSVEFCSGTSCNRTDKIIRAQVQVPEMLKLSNLSPYNPSSQSKPQRISIQLAYNQDRIIQHNTSHVTFHKYFIKSLQHHGVAIITNQVYKVAKA